MKIDVQHHKDLRKWRTSRTILEFQMNDKSKFKGKLLSTYTTAILIVDDKYQRYFLPMCDITSISEVK